MAMNELIELLERRRNSMLEHIFWVIGLASVSYTHLRAHETVLDLVCRLLLEKKHEKLTGAESRTLGVNDRAARMG